MSKEVKRVKVSNHSTQTQNKQKSFKLSPYYKCRYLYLLVLPALIWYAFFCYGPLYGLQLAFKDYRMIDGIWNSPWIGFEHFKTMFFGANNFGQIMSNTIIISLYQIIFGFPAPIILALLFNEIRFPRFKRTVQVITYLPHFMSWVVLTSLFLTVLSPSTGAVNWFLGLFGIKPIYFMGDRSWFRFTLVTTAIWKEVGWSCIIYLAALTAIDPSLYEAATVDGANRFKQLLFITLPSLLPTISIMLVLRMGGILNAGFDQIINMYSPNVYSVADVLDTYTYRIGMVNIQYGLSTAVGLFKNIFAFACVLLTNKAVKMMGQDGLF